MKKGRIFADLAHPLRKSKEKGLPRTGKVKFNGANQFFGVNMY
jgi:hypothetical protein